MKKSMFMGTIISVAALLAIGISGNILYHQNKAGKITKPQVEVSGILESELLDYKITQDQENTVEFYVRPNNLFYSVEDNTQPTGRIIYHGCLESKIRVELGTGNLLPRLKNGDIVTFKVKATAVEEGKKYKGTTFASCMTPVMNYGSDSVKSAGFLKGKLIDYSTKISK